MNQKIWRVKEAAPVLKTILAKELNISPVVAQLLINRGIYTVDAAQSFLFGDYESAYSPELLKDMNEAVNRILRALEKGEKILVYGDYDADGITSTALLINFFHRVGGIVDYYIPHRIEEGYGLHLPALERARDKGYTLVITVDCGISDWEIVKQNNHDCGPDIIITDHHEPPDILPSAFAIINPKRSDCQYPFKELAGVGVAYKLCQGLQKKLRQAVGEQELGQYLDLVCLGTVADIVPLLGENRVLVKSGLQVMANTCNPGLQALMYVSSVKSEDIGAHKISFALAPRLNAAGRMGDAVLAVELLLAGEYSEALEKANTLNSQNQQRQKIESMVMSEAMEMLEKQPDLASKKVIVLGMQNWHPGVIGIVASKLLDKFYRPVLLVSIEDNMGKGSARSIPGLNMYSALKNCQEYLLAYGGHAQAAGFSLLSSQLDEFREKINSYADAVLSDNDMIPEVKLDTVISLDQLNEELINQLNMLLPYGCGNPRPVLACRDVSLVNCYGVGRGKSHLKMQVRDKNINLEGIGFNLGTYEQELAAAREVDLAFLPQINQWNGKRMLQLEVKEIQQACTGMYSNSDNPVELEVDMLIEQREIMQEQSQEMFLPTFISKELVKFGILKNESKSFEDIIPYTEYISLPGSVEDYRNCPAKEEILRDICSCNGKKLIVVNYPYQTVEIFLFLINYNLATPEEILLNSYCKPKNWDMIREVLDGDRVKIIISTPEISFYGKIPVDSLVLYTIPMHPSEFYSLIEICAPCLVYSLFNEKDGTKAGKYLDSLAPERSDLAGFYNFLKYISKVKNSNSFSIEEAVNVMAKNNFSSIYDFSIILALKVFKELDLADYEYLQDNNYRFELHAVPGQKMSLNRSTTYDHLWKTKQASLTWQQKILNIDDFANLNTC
ncbi:MAG: single-stranded-DNA-specific exonuclease RecJ [Clostridiales bacterium]|nr:single-stranded-DNA-specific exonuclease RecJ [Clostridiales bacterium]MCF8021103.1 single-stranded-DNA-specific exonuclease RecJ [Clostridiales bacterium]